MDSLCLLNCVVTLLTDHSAMTWRISITRDKGVLHFLTFWPSPAATGVYEPVNFAQH